MKRAFFILFLFAVAASFAMPVNAEFPENKSKQPASRKPAAGPAVANRGGNKVVPENTVTVSGRVMTHEGMPIRGAYLVLLGLDGSAPRVTSSSNFGYYSFTGVTPGRTYVLGVVHSRYIFASPAQTIEVTGNLPDIVFLGEHNW